MISAYPRNSTKRLAKAGEMSGRFAELDIYDAFTWDCSTMRVRGAECAIC